MTLFYICGGGHSQQNSKPTTSLGEEGLFQAEAVNDVDAGCDRATGGGGGGERRMRRGEMEEEEGLFKAKAMRSGRVYVVVSFVYHSKCFV